MPRFSALVLAALFTAVAPGQESLKPEDLARIKAATVFVKVGAPRSGAISTGSGFLVKSEGESAWLVTNHHVVDLYEGADEARMLTTPIEVVFDGGTEKERTFKAKIAAFDPTRDLATLKIDGAAAMPAPIEIDEGIELRETMQVYICGFPFGGRLAIGTKNPEISIGDAKISSLRREVVGGPIAKVQLNGALNPGNSGGPVVAANGKLVGVAVTTVRNAGIGYAVPFHEVSAMMRGRFGTVSLVPKTDDDDPAKEIRATLRTRIIDPFEKVKTVAAYVLPGSAEVPKTMPNTPPGPLPGAMKIPMMLKDGAATADVTVPANAKKSLIVQLELELADGKVFTNALLVPVGPDRPEMPGRIAPPNNSYGPQRTPDGKLKLASGTILPIPSVPVRFPMAMNSESVSIVNARPEMFLDKTLRMDAVSSCIVNPVDRGEFELAVETDTDNVPTELRVVLPKDLALQVADLGIPELLQAVADIKYPIRLSGKVSKPAGREKRHTFLAESIEFLDDNDKPVATFKAATAPPAGPATLEIVNRFPEKFVGQTLTVEAFVKGTRHAGGTGLEIANANQAPPLNLESYTSRSLAGQVESDIAKVDLPARVKLTFEVKAIHGKTNKGVIGIKQVDVLGEGDRTAKSLKTSASVDYPFIPPPPKATPPRPKPDTAAAQPEDAKAPPAEGGGSNSTVIAAIAVSVVLFLGGGYFLMSALRKSKTAKEDVVETPVGRQPYSPRKSRPADPLPAPKPSTQPARPAKPASGADDNPFANFG